MTGESGQHTIQGGIQGLYGDLLYGWVIDSASPDLRVAVELYLDEAFIGLTRADQPQVGRNTPGDGLHGFSFHISRAWLNQANSISVRVANQGPWLPGRIDLRNWDVPDSPQPGTEADADNMPTAPRAHALHDGGLLIHGWAVDATDADRHVDVLVREDKLVHARTRADLRHPALVRHSSADHGFRLALPWSLADGELHELWVENDLGETLPGSPLNVCVRPEGLAATLHKFWPGTDKSREQAPFNLLLRLAQEQDKRAPHSLPFTAYPQWFELQQQEPVPMPVPGPGPGKTGPQVGALVLEQVLDDGDVAARATDATDITRKSLRRQKIKAQHICQTPIHQAVDGLEQLLQQGVSAVIVIAAGDHLALQALPRLLAALQTEQSDGTPAWVYPDCDQDDELGKRSNPWLKPAWDPDFFLGSDIFTVGALYSAEILRQALDHLTARQPATDARHWQYLACALVGVTQSTEATVAHLPMVLHHRAAAQPIAPFLRPDDPARKAALQWLVEQMDAQATVTDVPDFPTLKRVQWSLPTAKPKVTLIIPTRDQYTLLSRCLGSLLRYTDYPNVDVIVVDNDSQCERTLRYFDTLAEQGVKVIRYPYPFNYAAINNLAVSTAQGSLIGLINNDIEISPDQGGWLSEMVAQVLRPGVGAVGAKLQWSNGMVQHGGVVVGVNGLAAHVGNNWMISDPGYLGINQIVRRQSAVTAACLLTSKAAWNEVGGLNANDFAVNFNDVDYCLRLRRAGYTVIWTPFAGLVHAESASRGLDVEPSKAVRSQREQQNLRLHWTHHLSVDPSYHPGLSLDHGVGSYGGLMMPPNPGKVRLADISRAAVKDINKKPEH
ncbi:MAG: glycosyltransferase family 2 protein [Pseudohongiella sp.]|uniref:glycosyltransferase family 2 protein n=1 Tax=Pseudohongiella sp. TaxID=1979412 RepID=UPI0034A03B76